MTDIENNDLNSASQSFVSFDAVQFPGSSKETGLLQRFFNAITPSEQEVDSIHHHKICTHREDAEKVRADLETIREELRNEVEADLFPMITEVIDPMLRDVNRINRNLKRISGPQAVKEFNDWTEKAKLWVELFAEQHDKPAITGKVVDHIIERSMERIERDIKSIEAYFHNNLDMIALPEKKRERLEKDVKGLRALQSHPGRLTLKEVTSWRKDLDHKRADLFQEALDQIEE